MNRGIAGILALALAGSAGILPAASRAGSPRSDTPRVVLNAPGCAAPEGAAVRARGGEPGAAWRIVDWRGREVEGAGGAFDERGEAVLPPLPPGYYRMVSFAAKDAKERKENLRASVPPCEPSLATLAVVGASCRNPPCGVAGSPRRGAEGGAAFFAADLGSDWAPGAFDCPWNGGDTQRTLADLAALAGFRHARNRLKWARTQPRAGEAPDFGLFLRNAERLRERGIRLSGMFHDAPDWAGRTLPGAEGRLPRDLCALHRYCRAAAAAFGDCMDGWEFWNEPDIRFAPEPVWEYAAAFKAAALGFKAVRPDLPVLSGALCRPPGEAYEEALLASGIAPYFDLFNYHVYAPVALYGERFAALRALLARHGIAGRPIVVTESGTHLEGNGEATGPRPGLTAHSPEQELLVAEFYPKSQIALMKEGVARNYFFVFNAFNQWDGRKDWGVLRRDGSVKPVFAAMATMLRELDGKRYAGEIDLGPGVRASLFEESRDADGTGSAPNQTLVFWSESPIDTIAKSGMLATAEDGCARTIRLPVSFSSDALAALRLVDLCGMERPLAAEGGATLADGALALEATRYPAYFSGPLGLHGNIAAPGGAASPQPATAAAAHVPAAPAPLPPSPIVIRPLADANDFAVGERKTRAYMKRDTGRLDIELWNFGDAPATVVLTGAGAPVSGLPDGPVCIPPAAEGPLVFACRVEPDAAADLRLTLSLAAECDGFAPATAVLPLFFEKRFLDRCEAHPLDWREPTRWVRNDSANEYRCAFDDAQGAVRFETRWTDPSVDRWVYPVLPLDAGGLPADGDGIAYLRFEIRAEQDKVENDFKNQNVMLVFGGGRTGSDKSDVVLRFEPPSERWESRLVLLPGGRDLSAATALRIGANPLGTRCTLWLRNIELKSFPFP